MVREKEMKSLIKRLRKRKEDRVKEVSDKESTKV